MCVSTGVFFNFFEPRYTFVLDKKNHGTPATVKKRNAIVCTDL